MKIVKFFLILLALASIDCFSEDDKIKCSKDTQLLLSYFLNQTKLTDDYDYILKFIIYSGSNINELGNYEDCNRISNGKYFLVSYITSPQVVNFGFCYFKHCDEEILDSLKVNITNVISYYTNKTLDSSKIFFMDPQTALDKVRDKYQISFIISIIICLILVILPILSCIYVKSPSENSNKIDEEKSLNISSNPLISNSSKIQNFLKYFDLIENTSSILTVKEGDTNDKLRVLDGVRVFSMACVVIGHAYFMLLFTKVKNVFDISDFTKSFQGAIINSFTYSVDIFFFLSGFLFTINIQKYLGRNINKTKVIILGIIMRYIRLIPLYSFTVLILINFIPYLNSGPLYSFLGDVVEKCHTGWWSNLFFINNFVRYKFDTMCIGHSWYMSNDFQFFLFSILIYIIFNNQKKLRSLIFFSLFISSLIIQVIIVFVYKIYYLNTNNSEDYWNVYYVKPWCRITPYVIGIVFAELYMNIQEEDIIVDKGKPYEVEWMKQINFGIKKNQIYAKILFVFAIICIVYGIVINYYALNNEKSSLLLNAIYFLVNRTVFTLGIAILLHLTYLGNLYYLKEFLSLKIFTIIGRVSFGIYLIHILLMIIYYVGYPSNIYLRFSDILFYGIGFLTYSFIISFVISGLVESPVVKMMKGLNKN